MHKQCCIYCGVLTKPKAQVCMRCAFVPLVWKPVPKSFTYGKFKWVRIRIK